MIRLGDWSIGERLAAGFGLVLAALALFAGVAFHWQQASAQAEANYSQRIRVRSEAASALERAILHVGSAVRAYLLEPGGQGDGPSAASIQEARRSLRALAAAPKDSDGEDLFQVARPTIDRYLEAADAVVREHSGGDPRSADARLAQLRGEAITPLQSYADLQRDKARLAIAEMDASREKVARGLVLTFVVVAILLVAFGLAIAASIRDPARRLTRIAREVQEGHWEPALQLAPSAAAARGESLRPHDELASIGLAFGAAAQALERREQRLRADARWARCTGATRAARSSSRSPNTRCRTRWRPCAWARACPGVPRWKAGSPCSPTSRRGSR
jgi:CHASE3 domain sensor protein